jgi:hypothetical protein
MFGKLCTLGLALATVTVATAAALNSVLIDDFNDGNDDGWSHMDYTEGMPWGPAIYDASTGSYTIESAGPVPADDPNVGTIIATWEGSRNRPGFANGVIRGTVRANTPGTTAGLVLRANDEAHTNYGFYGSTSFGTFYIERFDGSQPNPQTIIAMADPNKAPFAAGEEWNFEAGAVGKHVWLKVWKVGDPEPNEPLLSLKDRVLPPASGSLVCVIVFFDPAAVGDDPVELSATFDDITFTPAARR